MLLCYFLDKSEAILNKRGSEKNRDRERNFTTGFSTF